jgi:hypothetical protein
VSGVGKTRFAQALFDDRIGQDALNSGLVVYGDLGQSPSTMASQVAEQLVHAQKAAVMVVDNCPGDTHRALASIIHRPGGLVSLLTIDFDIGRDQPQDTWVVQLHKNGDHLIEALLKTRVPALSVLDRNRVVEYADGNAGVALTIANAESGSGSLADLSDQQLIDRLFLDGRRRTDDTLRRCAEVASLVYAFHVEQENDQAPEHPILAELAEVSPLQMYRAIAEFVERGTAQKRGTQRAILPEALAIRLATHALERLPSEVVLAHFNQEGRERLFQSFTRRLGCLHQSESACRIAEQLLGADGLLSDSTNLSRFGLTLFQYLAPAAPEATLAAIERALNSPKGQEFASLDAPFRWEIATLTRSLAYDPGRFERAARVLLTFAKAEPEDHNNNAVRPHFLELFWIGLSWTQAPPEQRFAYIDELYTDGDEAEKELAVEALDHALTTGHRSSHHDGRFGSRPMGKEWRPKTNNEQNNWFRAALSRLASIACQDGNLAKKARAAISHELRGLVRIGLIDDVASAIEPVLTRGYWPEGWKLFCEALRFDRDDWPPETQKKAYQLEQKLRPKSIEDRFSTFVTNEPWGFYSIAETGENIERTNTFKLAEGVGEEAAILPDVWPSFVRDACAFRGSNNCGAFGRGLANAADNLHEMWRQIVGIFAEYEPGLRNAAVLSGFLAAANNLEPEEVQTWLDEAVADVTLGPHIVELSIYLPIDRRSITRLTMAVHADNAPIQSYRWLAGGRATDPTPTVELVDFLRALMATGSEGAIIAADIFHMHLFGHKDDQVFKPTLLAFGREILQSPELYKGLARDHTHDLEQIAKRCLPGPENEQVARRICELLLKLGESNHSALFNLHNFMKILGDLHTRAVLDAVLGSDSTANFLGEELFGRADDDPEKNLGFSIADNKDALIDWVKEEPCVRAVRVARFVRYFQEDSQGQVSWTPLARALFDLPCVGPKVLNEFHSRFSVGSGWGPWSSRFVRRRPLLSELTSHTDEAIRSWAKDALAKLDAHINDLTKEERSRDERFE